MAFRRPLLRRAALALFLLSAACVSVTVAPESEGPQQEPAADKAAPSPGDVSINRSVDGGVSSTQERPGCEHDNEMYHEFEIVCKETEEGTERTLHQCLGGWVDTRIPCDPAPHQIEAFGRRRPVVPLDAFRQHHKRMRVHPTHKDKWNEGTDFDWDTVTVWDTSTNAPKTYVFMKGFLLDLQIPPQPPSPSQPPESLQRRIVSN